MNSEIIIEIIKRNWIFYAIIIASMVYFFGQYIRASYLVKKYSEQKVAEFIETRVKEIAETQC